MTTATKGDLNLIAVTLNGPDDWNDHINMYEMGFHDFEPVKVLQKGMINEIEDPFYKNNVYIKNEFFSLLKRMNVNFSVLNINFKSPKKMA